MASYSYKDVDVPIAFQELWCKENDEDINDLQDGDPIDWSYWDMVGDYISHLESKLEHLTLIKDNPEYYIDLANGDREDVVLVCDVEHIIEREFGDG